MKEFVRRIEDDWGWSWERVPLVGQRVIVDYGHTINGNVWWNGNKFVNCYGQELYSILGWKEYEEPAEISTVDITRDVKIEIDTYRSKSLVNTNDDMVRVVLYLDKKKHRKCIRQFLNVQKNNQL